MVKGICELCQCERSSIKTIGTTEVCFLHVTEKEWDEEKLDH